jgi:hypothetical protein
MGHEQGTLGPDQVPQALVEEAAAPRDSPEVALSGVFTASRIQLRTRPRTHAQDRSEPSSLCARMRRASSSNFDGTNSSAGPTGNGSSAPSPISCTGMLSASSRPFAISASTKDEVHSTETRSSLTRSSWHVGSSPRDFGARATAHDVRLRTARTSSGRRLACPGHSPALAARHGPAGDNILERAVPNLSVQAVGFGPGSGRGTSVGECSLRSYTRSKAGA